MADIYKEKSHNLGREGALAKLREMARDLARKYGLDVTMNDSGATVDGTGLKRGVVEVTDTTVSAEIDLSFVGKLAKGKIETGIQEALDTYFG